MKVLLNAINLSSAGGLTVALNFLKSITASYQCQFVLIAPKGCGYEEFESYPNIECILFKPMTASYLARLQFDYITSKQLVARIKPDVIFTMGNFALPIKDQKQLLLFMWPYAIYPEIMQWQKITTKQKIIQFLRRYSFQSRLKYADIVAAQTKVAKERLLRYYPEINRLEVVPTAYSMVNSDKKVNLPEFTRDKINLLCLTRYYVHKNVETLVDVAKIFKKNKSNFRIVLTMDESQHANVAIINNRIQENSLNDYIINIGAVPIGSVENLYSKCHGLILPTKLESFSATYADAMYLGKSIFTSDLDFAREVCEKAAFYFDPDSASDIADKVFEGFNNEDNRLQKIEVGKQRSKSFPDWPTVAKLYLNLISQLSTNEHSFH